MENSIFKTPDLYQAAFLIASGCQLIQVESQSPKTQCFVFDDADKCHSLIITYINKRDLTPAKELVEAIKTVKVLLHSK